RALGVTQYLPEEDRYSMNRTQLFSQLCSLFGGRIAEELIGGFDGVTTGASNDIERATQMARNMVTKWGLNEKMGPILYGEDDSQAPGGGNTHYSEDTSREIDQEVKTILNDAYSRATTLLTENRDVLEAMTDALMEYETIDADQVDDLMNRRKVRPPRDWDKNDTDSNSGGQGSGKASDAASKESPIGGAVEDV
ncbi:MAG: ATP-dependent metalloprotease, partial [Porticoccaceae bacterium]|nr:ATP-dependent metalloprotease [Porticoccaceae bacterium]